MNQRLMLYRKVAAARQDDGITRILEEAEDRYRALPLSVLNLADYGRIRVMADRLGIDSIDREGRTVVLKFRPQAREFSDTPSGWWPSCGYRRPRS